MSILKSVSLLNYIVSALASVKHKESPLEDKWNHTFKTQQMNALQYLVLNFTNIASLLSIFDIKTFPKGCYADGSGNGLQAQMIAIQNCTAIRIEKLYAKSFIELRNAVT